MSSFIKKYLVSEVRGERVFFKKFVFLHVCVYACSIIYLSMSIGQNALKIDLKTYCGGKLSPCIRSASPGYIETNSMAASVIVGKQLKFVLYFFYIIIHNDIYWQFSD